MKLKRGTKDNNAKVLDNKGTNLCDFQPKPGKKHKNVYLQVFDATKKSMCMDEPGCFPITLSQENIYLMVAVKF